jgi:aromatic-L-amino-acid/L-tryptophan decarboxylase
MNPNMGGGNHGGIYVEQQVVDWCKAMFGFPPESAGLLLSGSSMANLIGLAAARNTRAGWDMRLEGLQGKVETLVVYGSQEMHSSLQKAVELLGLGSQALRKIPVDSEYRIDLDALRSALEHDRAAGLRPICLVGNAGTVNTGAFDDLEALGVLAREQGLWFHVDGAFGAVANITEDLNHLTRGLEYADSLSFDLHKWMQIPFEAGCILVRQASDLLETFSLTPAYLAKHTEQRGLASGAIWFSDYGLQLTRGFRALKVWMSMKEQGLQRYAALVEQNVEQARYLGQLVDQEPRLERLAPISLNIVCFRYRAGDLPDEVLNALNQELLIRLHESGGAVPSYTTLAGRFCIRAAITNHRSRFEDFDFLVREVIRLGDQLMEELKAS